MQNSKASLIEKYNIPAPRYTSYPTVPLWANDLKQQNWTSFVKQAFDDFGEKEGVTLYIHLPYCESLCTYCGCNKRITKNHKVETPYIESIILEWKKYLEIFEGIPKLAGIHLGGGTPTFFSADSLKEMLGFILKHAQVMDNAEFSFEGHPNNTTREHLQTLYDLGFRRVSYGIQDFDPLVQKTIHRIQPFERVKEATEVAREIGYTSINFDLIYGLPHQSLETITDTFEKVSLLKPDRIAYYSYAHLPSVFKAQRSFEEFLPNEQQKRSFYEKGKEILSEMGYFEIGMDHFSLEKDPLYQAKTQRGLHRNFMGYTTSPSKILLGLGNSSISDVYYAYAQNDKNIESYKAQINDFGIAIQKGHIMSEEDLQTRDLILKLICNHKADWNAEFYQGLEAKHLSKLRQFQAEGLLEYDGKGIKIKAEGIPFIRIICMTFDKRMQAKEEMQYGFSKAI
ncbi:Coproporphyrinogen III oxidase, oxygen-independent [Indibacter alkaliphilus LW1]|uniref:Coproporphyrinogen-III oxidase n=1 Tax=Indibacter alkaliphilus (strain CCUG 57479 / KCTC 22604 / LW1) TaxID=1189612 RepID=S2DK56_INDAL|nr:oxygen-independent coproporphyrinogen III oxidase [Indibacter alkaliphilus]EOZ92386.1 Coproporphyrinogen III oxidase, oxygen-independent [Indibacter alkaliphilus LW1]